MSSRIYTTRELRQYHLAKDRYEKAKRALKEARSMQDNVDAYNLVVECFKKDLPRLIKIIATDPESLA